MEPWALGLIAVLVLMFLGLPIAFAMGLVGVVGVALMLGNITPALHMIGQITFDTVLSYDLSVVPLFVLMGNFVTRAGMSDQLYAAAYAWLGRFRGGLAMSTIAACAGFSSVCGSSLATAATMARVAMPPMRRYGYHPSLATGSIAAGGSLGILIPPSVVLVLYGLMTSTDIGKLFVAGVLPGLLGALGYMAAIAVLTWRRPELGPPGEAFSLPQALAATRGVAGIGALFVIVVGGIYGGLFTPTEAAGIGASGAFLFALARRRLTLAGLVEVLKDSVITTAMLFSILIGALLFANFINLAGLPTALGGWVENSGLPPLAVLALILVVYVALGAVLESMSMILLTVPIFFPLVAGMGFDLIWFGIIVVVITEISLITPPVGMNVFVLRAVLPTVPTGTVFKGIVPFLLADLVRLVLLVLVPGIVLALPAMMD
ncbi:TRAP transporter large permease [Roseospirillum parvum]|uniref:TRAP transporter large permease protein n=1 Tax=Roseospirillum parvum TaxID=83401 RepID=A0A1G7X3X5_9PROT|nr:TRAP transporter large permease [Roseospirillum parvum]SDG78872.1 TRAP transporter, DctM subunit [Roseospirillum parvum]